MKKLLILIIAFTFFACGSDESETVLPSVVTLNAETQVNGGVILQGDFRNFGNNDEIGFAIFENASMRKYIVENPDAGENDYTVLTELELNKIYTYKAYIDTGSKRYYGLGKEFISTGSASVNFIAINPTTGDFKDKVRIVGDTVLPENYDYNKVKVFFNNTLARIVGFENKTIICKVPHYQGDPTATIKVYYYGKTYSTNLTFTLQSPEINSASPDLVTFQDEITINGNHFEKEDLQFVNVFIDDVQAQILETNEHSIRVKIPNAVSKKHPLIRVESNLQSQTVENLITLKSPQITTYPTSGNILNTMIINGTNFNPEQMYNSVYFGDEKAFVSSSTANRIVVTIPSGPYSNYEPVITAKVSDELVSEEKPFSVLDPSIRVKKNIEVPFYKFHLYNNQIYGYEFGDGTMQIGKFNDVTFEFYDIQTINIPNYGYATRSFKTNNEFIYIIVALDQNNFYRYNLNTNSLEQLADFPNEITYNSLIAIYNENITVSNGGTTNGSSYKYNVLADTWTVANSNTNLPAYNNFYNANNDSYFVRGYASEDKQLFKFDGNNYVNTGQVVQNYTREYVFKDGSFYFIEPNSILYEHNRLFIFNQNANTWIEKTGILPNLNVLGIFNNGDNKIYAVVIDSYHNYDLFQIDINRLP